MFFVAVLIIIAYIGLYGAIGVIVSNITGLHFLESPKQMKGKPLEEVLALLYFLVGIGIFVPLLLLLAELGWF